MDNIHTFDKVIYQKANEIQTRNYFELFQYFLYELYNIICLLLFIIKYLLKKFVIVLIHPWGEKKNIKKHLAVVRKIYYFYFSSCWFYTLFCVCDDISISKIKVTGGGNGLGREISLRLGKVGCNIAILDVDIVGARQTVKDLTLNYGVEAKAYKVRI